MYILKVTVKSAQNKTDAKNNFPDKNSYELNRITKCENSCENSFDNACEDKRKIGFQCEFI